MSKQTAVEWIKKQLDFLEDNMSADDIKWLFGKAEAMEKEQIVDAWDKRCSHGVVSQTWHIETKNGEQYYNETYKGGEQ
jgi:hypothetical protein